MNSGEDWKAVARAIDHTLLKPEATPVAIRQLCREAVEFGFGAVCVQPWQVALARAVLRGSAVKTACVVGFPQGATLTVVKRYEAAQAIVAGAQELDMVMNLGAMKAGDTDYVRNDIRAVTGKAHEHGVLVKVIIEASLLANEEKILACELAMAAEADFVKTSTGFAGGGATVEDVALMRSVVAGRIGVKAAGGIRVGRDAVAMLKAGADRLGTSASVQIMRDLGFS